jgi:ribose 1,5-bisphosphokinase
VSIADTAAREVSGRIGPGRLVVVVGPSGAGKDTLIGLVRAACADRSDVVFPRRTVTREASVHEDNEPLAEAAFDAAASRGAFALWWHAHGLKYGLRNSIDADIRAGRTVIVNISRTVVDQVKQRYVNVVVVLVTAPAEVLAARLASRDRASDGVLAERLNRVADRLDLVPDIEIVNIGAAAERARELLAAIEGRA